MSRERAERVAAEFKGLRVESTLRCPHRSCRGRPVAHVVAHEGERVLWVIGGVDQQEKGTLEGAGGDLRHSTARLRDATSPAAESYWRSRVEWLERYVDQLASDRGVDVQAWAQAIGPSYAQTDLPAPCSRCHRAVLLRIERDGGVSYAPTR